MPCPSLEQQAALRAMALLNQKANPRVRLLVSASGSDAAARAAVIDRITSDN
jgi:hypothetical protein